MNTEVRKTAISQVQPGKILLRGYEITELAGKISWGAAVYLTIVGELPAAGVGRMLDAILVSIIDHGPTPVSTLAACTVASAGASLSASVAAGILAIAKHHGAAISDCMQVLEDSVARGLEPRESAAQTVREFRQRRERIPGFGHRQHANDPRCDRLFEIASQENLAGKYVRQAKALESELEAAMGKKLPLNADGAIAAILCGVKFPQHAANGLFMIARVAGLVAHCVEEQERNAPLRPIHPTEYLYDGVKERKLTTIEPKTGHE
jgi:citrate synthase